MRLAMNLSAAALTAALVCVSGTVSAEPTQASFHPVLDKHEINNFMYDSDFVPADADLQIRLTAGIRDELTLDMPGNGEYEWDDSMITLIGDDGQGEIDYGVIADTEITIKVTLFGQEFEVDVIEAVLGGQPLEIGINASDVYTPYSTRASSRPVSLMNRAGA